MNELGLHSECYPLLVRDDPKVLDDSREVPKTERSDWLAVKFSFDGKTSQGGQVHDVLQIK